MFTATIDEAQLAKIQERIQAEMPAALHQLRDEVAAIWSSLIDAKYKGTKSQYQAAMGVSIIEPDTVRCQLKSSQSWAIGPTMEKGMPGFDLAPGFIRGLKTPEMWQTDARGPKVIRTMVRNGVTKKIPIDTGYTYKGTGNWHHPGFNPDEHGVFAELKAQGDAKAAEIVAQIMERAFA